MLRHVAALAGDPDVAHRGNPAYDAFVGKDQDKLESLSETIVDASDEMAATAEHMADAKSVDIDLQRIQQKLRQAHEAIEESRVRVAKALEAAQEDRDRHKHQ